MTLFQLGTWENLVYQGYHYPWWAHAVGYFMAGSSMLCIPGRTVKYRTVIKTARAKYTVYTVQIIHTYKLILNSSLNEEFLFNGEFC